MPGPGCSLVPPGGGCLLGLTVSGWTGPVLAAILSQTGRVCVCARVCSVCVCMCCVCVCVVEWGAGSDPITDWPCVCVCLSACLSVCVGVVCVCVCEGGVGRRLLGDTGPALWLQRPQMGRLPCPCVASPHAGSRNEGRLLGAAGEPGGEATSQMWARFRGACCLQRQASYPLWFSFHFSLLGTVTKDEEGVKIW